jgi:hypothetical protein
METGAGEYSFTMEIIPIAKLDATIMMIKKENIPNNP